MTFRLKGVANPGGIPIIGRPTPVASMRIVLMSDGTSQIQLPGHSDVAAALLVRLFRAMVQATPAALEEAKSAEEVSND